MATGTLTPMRLVDGREREVEDTAQREAGEEAARELRGPVGGHVRPRMQARDREPERHRGIEVPARYRPERGHRDRERDAVRDRDRPEAPAAAVRVGDDRAGPDEEEPERARGFRQQGAGVLAHHASLPSPSGIVHAWPTSVPSRQPRRAS
jgi:hypothetical protein